MPGLDPFNRAATQRDADIIRERLDQLFNLAPAGSVVADPQKRAKLFHAAADVIELTAQLAAVNAFVPGRLGRIFATAVSGVEKPPDTGKVQVGQGTAMNFAPSPIGFLDPTTVGLKRNFYLPGGSTNFIPRAADRIGIGLPQQRAEDEAANAARSAAHASSIVVKVRQLAAAESTSSLQIITGPTYPFQRGLRIAAANEVPFDLFQEAARQELHRRNATDTTQLTPLVAGLSTALQSQALVREDFLGALADTTAALDQEQARVFAELRASGVNLTGAAGPLGQPVATGSIQPEAIEPTNDAAIRNRNGASGINRELVHERADP